MLSYKLKSISGPALAVLLGCLIPFTAAAQESEATRKLKARNAEFREEVIKVTDGVYTSMGHTVSTVSMVVGTDGIIIIDTGMAPDHAKKILADFRKITDKPIKTIILTHGHGDHTMGFKVFSGKDNPDIWARANFGSESNSVSSAGIQSRFRGLRQAGMRLPPEKRINNGVAPAMYPFGRPGSGPSKGKAKGPSKGTAKGKAKGKGPSGMFAGREQVKPNRTFSEDRKKIEVSGVKIEMVAAPGETSDQLYVWLPDKKVVFSGDNFYKSFPNLYAIRGTPFRDAREWANANDMMLKEGAEYLVPGHTRPILGKEAVTQALTDYRDAIRFVFDKTVEGINKQLTPDELVDYVKLPKHLAEKDYLGEYYGNVEWAVRAIFTGYLGWFDGNATSLFPLNPKEEAERIAKLAGGKNALLTQAKNALSSGDYQWAAQLADHLLALDKTAVEPKKIKADALEALGKRLMTATGRNYYLTVAQELRGEIANMK
jgi:uncharacterized sulfatase